MSHLASSGLGGKSTGTLNVQHSSLLKASVCSKNNAPEHVHTAAYKYLLRRQYGVKHSEVFKRRTVPQITTHSLREMALRQVVENEASSNDCFQFSTDGCTDPRLVEQQYARFKVLISESPDYYKPELAQLLYPMFTHLYLELVNSGKKADAQKFHKKHQSTFLGNGEFAQFIRRLIPITTTDDIYRDEVVTTYYHSRYSVTLSNKTFYYLMKYLYSQYHSNQNGNTIILLQILRTKVDLKLSDALGACSKSEAVQNIKIDIENIEQVSESVPSSRKVLDEASRNRGVPVQNNAEDTNMDRLNQIIRAVHENGPTPLPSTCLYKIVDDNSSATTSASISDDFCLMALGCEDSSVSVWDLLPSSSTLDNQLIHPSEPVYYNPPADIPLGYDRNQSCHSRLKLENNSDLSSKRKIMLGHSGPVYDVAFVPNICQKESKNLLLSVSRDKTMRLWNVSETANISVYKGHTYPIWSVDVDSIGANIITGSMDRTAKLWQLEYTHPIRMYAGHEADVDIVKFHPNCNYLATASADKTVRLWSHADAKMARVFTGNTAGIYSLAFSPNGKFLASGGEDGIVRIWDIASSSVLKELKGHTDIIYALVWSQDSSLLASSGLDGAIRLWDVKLLSIKIDDELHSALEANGPSKLFSTGDGMENSIKNNTSSELKACYPTSCSNILKLAYSPHNTLVATGVASSSAQSGGITGVATISNSSTATNKALPHLGLPTGIVNPPHNQGMSVGFTKIFINGTGNNCAK